MSDKPAFITIACVAAKDFQEAVNTAIAEGYVLHGEPMFQMVSCQDEWDGRQRSWTEQKYVQCMKLK